MPRKSTLKSLAGSPEVDNSGVYPRGSNTSQKLVTVNDPNYGDFKKKLIAAVILLQTSVIYIGMYAEWEEYYVHPAYILGGISAMGILTLAFSKVK